MSAIKKYIWIISIAIVACCATSGCSSDDAWNELPSTISQFVSKYFPEQGVSGFGESDGIYHVKMKNGAALSFASDYSWISVNGYGGTLPQMFLFDQLPPELYEYIQGLDQLKDVYSVTRDDRHYTVSLLDSSIIYETATGKISYPRAAKVSVRI